MTWQIGLVANTVIAIAYFAICASHASLDLLRRVPAAAGAPGGHGAGSTEAADTSGSTDSGERTTP